MKLGRFFWSYSRHYLPWAVLIAFVVPIYGLASAGMVALIEPIFDEVLLAGSDAELPMGLDALESADSSSRFNLKALADRAYRGAKQAFGIDATNVMYFTPALLFCVFLIRGMANFVSGFSFQRIGLGVCTDIRNDMYQRLLDQSSRFHAVHTSGELVSRVINDVNMLQSIVTARLFDSVQQTVTLVLLLGLLLSTNFQLALASMVVVPVVVFVIARFGRGMRRASHRSQERMEEVASLLTEGVRGHRVVKAFGMQDFENERFRAATHRHLKVNLWAQMLGNLSGPAVEAIVALGAATFLLYAALKIRSGELTAPLLVQFMANLLFMVDPIRKLNKVNLILQSALAAGQRLSGMLALPNEIQDKPGAIELTEVRHGFHFENINFAYGEVPILQDIDLEIASGEMIALVGPSGAGKSTLVNLLPRFFDTDAGRVTIDGHDIRDVTLVSLRSLIGLVTQETTLFNDTVRNNIAYGRSDLSLERVREASRAAYADDFISELENGYDTMIGEQGTQLSGGQRQRLTIARAILKDAPILILDEATSHLDSHAEALVQKALSNLVRSRTTLVIAHRMSTIIEADRIVVLDGGRVVEQGSHRELLERGGVYKHLFDLQFDRKTTA